MSLNKLIITTLKPTDVPVAFQVHNGPETTYIRFFEVVDIPSFHADDQVTNTQKTIQFDIFSKENYELLVKKVKELLEKAGFLWSSGRELYEEDTALYHYVLTYNYNINF